MDLMKGSTSFRSLRKKYDDFSAPSVEVTVGSTKLVSEPGQIFLILELELTSGFEASGCVFYIDGAYDEKNTDFKKFTDKIQIGESVEIALGYVRRESVFKGYINEVEYQYGMEDDRNRIRVNVWMPRTSDEDQTHGRSLPRRVQMQWSRQFSERLLSAATFPAKRSTAVRKKRFRSEVI